MGVVLTLMDEVESTLSHRIIDRDLNQLLHQIEKEKIVPREIVEIIFERLGPLTKESSEFYFYFIEIVFKQEQFELLYENLTKKKLHERSYRESEILLLCMYSMGQIKNFLNESKNLCEYIINEKYYACCERFFIVFDKHLNKSTFFQVGMILYYVEIEDVNRLSDKLHEIKKEIYNGKVNLSVIESIHNVIELYLKDHIAVYTCKLLYKLILTKLKKIEVINKEIIECLLVATKPEHFCLIYEALRGKSGSPELLNYIKNNLALTMIQIPSYFENTKKDLENKISIQRSVAQEKNAIEDIDLSINSSQVALNDSIDEERYKICDEEKKLIQYFNVDHEMVENASEMVISFIEMGFYKMAELTVAQMEDSSNKFYLLSEIYLSQGEYAQAIYQANTCLTDYDLDGERALPMELIKAKAFELLEDKISAKNCYAKILSIDPDFGQERIKVRE
ncbi:MAG: hypothetical protein HON90_12405 [Halobacteriovoraceae bacterium]|nr:hypothetical protein [Halobacteriovoraceae bacterium]